MSSGPELKPAVKRIRIRTIKVIEYYNLNGRIEYVDRDRIDPLKEVIVEDTWRIEKPFEQVTGDELLLLRKG